MQAFARPIGYIRRSVVRKDGDISKEYQIDRVRALAGKDGPTLDILAGDWGRGGGRRDMLKRKDYLEMVRRVEAGECSAIFAYSCDRLARDVEAAAHLLNECERVGIPIVTTEGRFEPGDPYARRLFHMMAEGNEAYSDSRHVSANLTIEVRRKRGDTAFGRAPYGLKYNKDTRKRGEPAEFVPDPDARPDVVVAAFIRGGSYMAAARILNSTPEMMPAMLGGKWAATTVRGIIERVAPKLVPLRTRSGARTRSRRPFSGLLRCPWADRHPASPWLTSGPAAGRERWRYICRIAQGDPTHPRPHIVSERRVRAWAQAYVAAELGKRLAVEVEGQSPDDLAKVEALDKRRDRTNTMFELGTITQDEYVRRINAIDAERPRLVASGRAVKRFQMRDYIDWDEPASEVNSALKELWSEVILDPATLTPLYATWNLGQSPAEREAAELTPEQEHELAMADYEAQK